MTKNYNWCSIVGKFKAERALLKFLAKVKIRDEVGTENPKRNLKTKLSFYLCYENAIFTGNLIKALHKTLKCIEN